MQSSQLQNVGLQSTINESSEETPAWARDPTVAPLAFFSPRSRKIRATKQFVSELAQWRKSEMVTLRRLKGVQRRIMMFLQTEASYLDNRILLECDLEEEIIALLALYMDFELRILTLSKKEQEQLRLEGKDPQNKLIQDAQYFPKYEQWLINRCSRWLYTLLPAHDRRVDALLSTTVYSSKTRAVLDPLFRKVLWETPKGPLSSVSYVRHMIAYKIWRERALVAEDEGSKALNDYVRLHLHPKDFKSFPRPLLRCLGRGGTPEKHARPNNINLKDACLHFKQCKDFPDTISDAINYESLEIFKTKGDEVDELMDMITERKNKRKTVCTAVIDLTSEDVIDLTIEDDSVPLYNQCAVNRINRTPDHRTQIPFALRDTLREPLQNFNRIVTDVHCQSAPPLLRRNGLHKTLTVDPEIVRSSEDEMDHSFQGKTLNRPRAYPEKDNCTYPLQEIESPLPRVSEVLEETTVSETTTNNSQDDDLHLRPKTPTHINNICTNPIPQETVSSLPMVSGVLKETTDDSDHLQEHQPIVPLQMDNTCTNVSQETVLFSSITSEVVEEIKVSKPSTEDSRDEHLQEESIRPIAPEQMDNSCSNPLVQETVSSHLVSEMLVETTDDSNVELLQKESIRRTTPEQMDNSCRNILPQETISSLSIISKGLEETRLLETIKNNLKDDQLQEELITLTAPEQMDNTCSKILPQETVSSLSMISEVLEEMRVSEATTNYSKDPQLRKESIRPMEPKQMENAHSNLHLQETMVVNEVSDETIDDLQKETISPFSVINEVLVETTVFKDDHLQEGTVRLMESICTNLSSETVAPLAINNEVLEETTIPKDSDLQEQTIQLMTPIQINNTPQETVASLEIINEVLEEVLQEVFKDDNFQEETIRSMVPEEMDNIYTNILPQETVLPLPMVSEVLEETTVSKEDHIPEEIILPVAAEQMDNTCKNVVAQDTVSSLPIINEMLEEVTLPNVDYLQEETTIRPMAHEQIKNTSLNLPVETLSPLPVISEVLEERTVLKDDHHQEESIRPMAPEQICTNPLPQTTELSSPSIREVLDETTMSKAGSKDNHLQEETTQPMAPLKINNNYSNTLLPETESLLSAVSKELQEITVSKTTSEYSKEESMMPLPEMDNNCTNLSRKTISPLPMVSEELKEATTEEVTSFRNTSLQETDGQNPPEQKSNGIMLIRETAMPEVFTEDSSANELRGKELIQSMATCIGSQEIDNTCTDLFQSNEIHILESDLPTDSEVLIETTVPEEEVVILENIDSLQEASINRHTLSQLLKNGASPFSDTDVATTDDLKNNYLQEETNLQTTDSSKPQEIDTICAHLPKKNVPQLLEMFRDVVTREDDESSQESEEEKSVSQDNGETATTVSFEQEKDLQEIVQRFENLVYNEPLVNIPSESIEEEVVESQAESVVIETPETTIAEMKELKIVETSNEPSASDIKIDSKNLKDRDENLNEKSGGDLKDEVEKQMEINNKRAKNNSKRQLRDPQKIITTMQKKLKKRLMNKLKVPQNIDTSSELQNSVPTKQEHLISENISPKIQLLRAVELVPLPAEKIESRVRKEISYFKHEKKSVDDDKIEEKIDAKIKGKRKNGVTNLFNNNFVANGSEGIISKLRRVAKRKRGRPPKKNFTPAQDVLVEKEETLSVTTSVSVKSLVKTQTQGPKSPRRRKQNLKDTLNWDPKELFICCSNLSVNEINNLKSKQISETKNSSTEHQPMEIEKRNNKKKKGRHVKNNSVGVTVPEIDENADSDDELPLSLRAQKQNSTVVEPAEEPAHKHVSREVQKCRLNLYRLAKCVAKFAVSDQMQESSESPSSSRDAYEVNFCDKSKESLEPMKNIEQVLLPTSPVEEPFLQMKDPLALETSISPISNNNAKSGAKHKFIRRKFRRKGIKLPNGAKKKILHKLSDDQVINLEKQPLQKIEMISEKPLVVKHFKKRPPLQKIEIISQKPLDVTHLEKQPPVQKIEMISENPLSVMHLEKQPPLQEIKIVPEEPLDVIQIIESNLAEEPAGETMEPEHVSTTETDDIETIQSSLIAQDDLIEKVPSPVVETTALISSPNETDRPDIDNPANTLQIDKTAESSLETETSISPIEESVETMNISPLEISVDTTNISPIKTSVDTTNISPTKTSVDTTNISQIETPVDTFPLNLSLGSKKEESISTTGEESMKTLETDTEPEKLLNAAISDICLNSVEILDTSVESSEGYNPVTSDISLEDIKMVDQSEIENSCLNNLKETRISHTILDICSEQEIPYAESANSSITEHEDYKLLEPTCTSTSSSFELVKKFQTNVNNVADSGKDMQDNMKKNIMQQKSTMIFNIIGQAMISLRPYLDQQQLDENINGSPSLFKETEPVVQNEVLINIPENQNVDDDLDILNYLNTDVAEKIDNENNYSEPLSLEACSDDEGLVPLVPEHPAVHIPLTPPNSNDVNYVNVNDFGNFHMLVNTAAKLEKPALNQAINELEQILSYVDSPPTETSSPDSSASSSVEKKAPPKEKKLPSKEKKPEEKRKTIYSPRIALVKQKALSLKANEDKPKHYIKRTQFTKVATGVKNKIASNVTQKKYLECEEDKSSITTATTTDSFENQSGKNIEEALQVSGQTISQPSFECVFNDHKKPALGNLDNKSEQSEIVFSKENQFEQTKMIEAQPQRPSEIIFDQLLEEHKKSLIIATTSTENQSEQTKKVEEQSQQASKIVFDKVLVENKKSSITTTTENQVKQTKISGDQSQQPLEIVFDKLPEEHKKSLISKTENQSERIETVEEQPPRPSERIETVKEQPPRPSEVEFDKLLEEHKRSLITKTENQSKQTEKVEEQPQRPSEVEFDKLLEEHVKPLKNIEVPQIANTELIENAGQMDDKDICNSMQGIGHDWLIGQYIETIDESTDDDENQVKEKLSAYERDSGSSESCCIVELDVSNEEALEAIPVSIDINTIDWSKVDWSKIDMSKIDPQIKSLIKPEESQKRKISPDDEQDSSSKSQKMDHDNQHNTCQVDQEEFLFLGDSPSDTEFLYTEIYTEVGDVLYYDTLELFKQHNSQKTEVIKTVEEDSVPDDNEEPHNIQNDYRVADRNEVEYSEFATDEMTLVDMNYLQPQKNDNKNKDVCLNTRARSIETEEIYRISEEDKLQQEESFSNMEPQEMLNEDVVDALIQTQRESKNTPWEKSVNDKNIPMNDSNKLQEELFPTMQPREENLMDELIPRESINTIQAQKKTKKVTWGRSVAGKNRVVVEDSNKLQNELFPPTQSYQVLTQDFVADELIQTKKKCKKAPWGRFVGDKSRTTMENSNKLHEELFPPMQSREVEKNQDFVMDGLQTQKHNKKVSWGRSVSDENQHQKEDLRTRELTAGNLFPVHSQSAGVGANKRQRSLKYEPHTPLSKKRKMAPDDNKYATYGEKMDNSIWKSLQDNKPQQEGNIIPISKIVFVKQNDTKYVYPKILDKDRFGELLMNYSSASHSDSDAVSSSSNEDCRGPDSTTDDLDKNERLRDLIYRQNHRTQFF